MTATTTLNEMVRVRPLTIGAVFKKGNMAGQGYVLNLSRGGLFLSTQEPFEVGEEVRVRFLLPFQLGQVDATACVRWRTGDVANPPSGQGEGVGLSFVSIERETKLRIEEFIVKFCDLAEKLEAT
jgi:uncharacterized protein (TIGR02266 family)